MRLTADQQAELRGLATKDGRLEPRRIVDHAMNPSSSLHGLFTWDDQQAAEKYRLQQAREVIRTLRVTMTINRVEVRIPEYIRDPDAGAQDGTYRHIAHVKTDSNRARDALVAELQRFRAQGTRVKHLALLLGDPADVRWVEDAIKAAEIAAGRALAEHQTNIQ